jgi:glutamyl endopeptidase
MRYLKLAQTMSSFSILLMAGALLPGQAVSSPHDSVSSDGSYEPVELGTEAWGGKKSKKTSEAFAGADEITNEALRSDGVEIYDDLGGQLSSEELERLSALPVPSGTDETGTTEEGTEAILGPDTRQRLYTTRYPTRAQVLVTFRGGRCSGTMIGPNTVATAGHCVHTGGSSGRWRSGFRVYPGANGRSTPYGSCTARRLYSVSGWTNSRDARYDYGAIKLNCTIGNTVGWYGFTTANPRNQPSIIQGYPGDKPLTQWASSDKVHATTSRQVFYKNDTLGGMSGSAVWYDRNGPYMIGIHAYRNHGTGLHSLYNHGTRIVRPVFNNLLRWKNAR